ncbi:hypothetical protein ALMP_16930 [Streptomyces sp. A012304]|nr:hypothetical protein ALMP_16930 [Streptomyces sp. A012304]
MESDARVLAAVRTIGARHGVDYTDDAAVGELLAERRAAVEATQRGWPAWVGGLALTAGIIWPFAVHMVPSLAAELPVSYAPAGPLLVIAVAALTTLRQRWKRELTHRTLVGYREVLGVARAHGLPVTHIPAWLEGKSYGGTGKGAVPVPTSPPVTTAAPAPAMTTATSAPTSTPTSAPAPAQVPLPPKPQAVEAYERMADAGGWHDEVGWLLLFAGAIGAGYAWREEQPAGLAALLLIPLAFGIWLAGHRQGKEKRRLRGEALAYVHAVTHAQASGAPAPELSPVLRRLLDEERGTA